MIGTVLRGRYEIQKKLRSGGFSNVYLATDKETPSRQCIVKQLKLKISSPQGPKHFLPKVQEMFKKEAKQIQELGDISNQIPTLYTHFQEGGDFYLVMEYIEGCDLREEIREGLNMEEKTAFQLLKDILDVLTIVHEKNVIHRDIKPENLRRRSRDSKVVLIDFGAIKEVAHQGTIQNKRHASKSIAIGTEGYIPPEQAGGRPKLSSDIYALGTMMIEALTGIAPSKIPRDSKDEFVWRAFAPQVKKPAFADYLDKMVRQDFSQRFENANVALAELEKVGSNVYVDPNDPVHSRQGNQTSVDHNQGGLISKIWIVAIVLMILSGGFALSNISHSDNVSVKPNRPTPNPAPNTPIATPSLSPTSTPTASPSPTLRIGEYLPDDLVLKLLQRGWILCYDYQNDNTCKLVEYSSGFGNDDGLIQQLAILDDGVKMVATQKLTRSSEGSLCTTITTDFYDSISFFKAKNNTAWIGQTDKLVKIDTNNKNVENIKRSVAQRTGQEVCRRYYVKVISPDGKITQVQEHAYVKGGMKRRLNDSVINFVRPDYAKTNIRLRPQN